MRRIPIAVTLVALALLAAACSSASGPAWTYAPPTAAPSVGASAGASGAPGAASGGPSAAAPSGEASGGPTAVPGGSGGAGGDVVIEAHNIQFTTPEVQAPADAPFTIEFRNGDAGTPHNVEINDPSGAQVFMGPVVNGVTVAKYDVPALAAGSYPFKCTVHPNMTGTLKVGG